MSLFSLETLNTKKIDHWEFALPLWCTVNKDLSLNSYHSSLITFLEWVVKLGALRLPGGFSPNSGIAVVS